MCISEAEIIYFLSPSGMEGIRFDDQGMVLPHSILGSLEEFRNYLEAKGETEVNSEQIKFGYIVKTNTCNRNS